MTKSRYVALEGLDGTGKSTVIPMVADRLARSGVRVGFKPEFPLGRLDEEFRAALVKGLFLPEHLEMAPVAAFFYLLYADAFSLSHTDFQGVDIVLADRCHYTQSMYQAYFASDPRDAFDPHQVKETLECLYRMFGLRLPDAIFVLNAPADTIIGRLQKRERREVTLNEKVVLSVFSDIYRSFAAADSPRAMLVEATGSPSSVADELAELIRGGWR